MTKIKSKVYQKLSCLLWLGGMKYILGQLPLINKEDVIVSEKSRNKKYDRNDTREKPEGDEKLIDNEFIDGKYTTITIKTDTFERILRRKQYPGESVDQILNKVFNVMTNRKFKIITKKDKKINRK